MPHPFPLEFTLTLCEGGMDFSWTTAGNTLRSQATLPINTNKIKAMLFFEGKIFSYQQNLWMQKNVVSQVVLELVFTVNFSVESVF